MAKINQDLLDRLGQKLGVGPAAVYARIGKTGQKHRVARRDVAALLLAWELGISVQKYATQDQLDRLDRVTSGEEQPRPAGAPPSGRQSTRKAKAPKSKTISNTVFVVHGRDEPLRKSMFDFLRALDLRPQEWSHAVHATKGNNPHVDDIIATVMAKAQAVVVLFSPDEIAYLKQQFCGPDNKADGKPQPQARPNVLFEAGLALGAHSKKTILVQVGKVRSFSDIGGMHIVRLTDDVAKRNELANRLEKIGCDVNRKGQDWMKAGAFVPTEPKPKHRR